MVIYKLVTAQNIMKPLISLKADTIINELRSIDDYTTRHLQTDVECDGDIIHVRGITMQNKYNSIKLILAKYGISKVITEESGRFVHMLSYDLQVRFHIDVCPIIVQQPPVYETNTPSRRVLENSIIIEIQDLCKTLVEPVQITPFVYTPKSAFDEQYVGENIDIEIEHFNKWYKDAVKMRDSLKTKLETIKANILNMEKTSKCDKTQDTSDIKDTDLGESLEYLGFSKDITPTKTTLLEIRRRYKLKLNPQNVQYMQSVKKTLSRYGFFAKIQKPRKIRRRTLKTKESVKEEPKSFF